LESPNKHH
jgi:serine/threonine protein phosphatase PrpC